MHRWTDEDACFAAAQWASGIKQREIGEAFGCRTASMVCQKIEQFISKYGPSLYKKSVQCFDGRMYRGKKYSADRLPLVKPAIAEFVRQRNARLS
jgi:hypothetical protein